MTNWLKRLQFISMGLFMLATAPAQAQVEQDEQLWNAVLASKNLDDAYNGGRLWFDGHLRRGDTGTVIIVRPGIGHQLAPWVSVWAGYAWVPTLQDNTGLRIDEHRAWQQVIFKRSMVDGRFNLQARTRFEQRFRELGSGVGLRVREFVRADYRFGESRWGVVLWDELFWGLNNTDWTTSGFDQNRVFLGPAFHTDTALRVEFGYLNATLRRQDLTFMQHTLALNLFVAL